MATAPQPSQSRLSTRVSLRWLPDPPFENTDTLVMSVGEWYVDLRIDQKTNDIDWAIAGQRLVESEEPLRVVFTHEIDSHNDFEAVDCGTFVTLPNGDELETGSMPRPDRPGAPVTSYEEVWRNLSFREGPEGPGRGISWVLESDDGSESTQQEAESRVSKVFLARIWGTYIALHQEQAVTRCDTFEKPQIIRKTGAVVSARREEWSSGWIPKYLVGPKSAELPSMSNIMGKEEWQGQAITPGENITVGGRRYTVRAFEQSTA